MADAVVEREHQVGRRVLVAERRGGALRDFDEVHLAARGEHQLQLRHRERQHLDDCFEHLPLLGRVLRRRKLCQRDERLAQSFDAGQLIGGGRQAAPFAGFGQHRCGECLPAVYIGGRRERILHHPA